jgi:hypothetical protein
MYVIKCDDGSYRNSWASTWVKDVSKASLFNYQEEAANHIVNITDKIVKVDVDVKIAKCYRLKLTLSSDLTVYYKGMACWTLNKDEALLKANKQLFNGVMDGMGSFLRDAVIEEV